MMNTALEMDTTTPFLSDLDIDIQNKAEPEGSSNINPEASFDAGEYKDDEWSSSIETDRYASTPSSASASILSMPDPLLSSDTTSVQYDTIHPSDYARALESTSEVSFRSVGGHAISDMDGVGIPELGTQLVPHRHRQHRQKHDSDHSDHEYGSESEAGSESSFPSVTSSFFFSSPASVASHGPGNDSHEELNEDGGSESSRAQGLRVTQELIIPSLILPESLFLPNTASIYDTLNTPHASKYSNARAQGGGLPSVEAVCLLIVASSKLDITNNARSLFETVKNELDNANSLSREVDLRSVVSPGQDVESVLTTVIDSFNETDLFTAVVLVSDIPEEVAQLVEALSPLIPVILLHTHRDGPAPSFQNSPLVERVALCVSSAQELHDILIEKPEVSQLLRAEALEKFMSWAKLRRQDEGPSQLKEDIQSMVNRHSRFGAAYGHGVDDTTLGHVKDETVSQNGNARLTANSEGNWRQFKAQWEASWEDAYSWHGQEHLSREVAIKLHEAELQQDQLETTDDELLRTAKIASAGPPTFVTSAEARKRSRSKKLAFNRQSSSSSSSPLPATSPSLPGTSSLPSTMPSSLSLSLSESFFVSADELPESPLLQPVPLVMTFPFPSTTVSILPPPSRDPSRARSRGVTPGSSFPFPSERYSSSSTPFILNLHAGRFDPLHLPSFIALSFSLLAPLRAQVWSATHRLLTMPFMVVSPRAGDNDDDEGGSRTGDEEWENHKLACSVDSVGNHAHDPQTPPSSSAYRFQRALWPTGVMLVGGFLLGFAVGYLKTF